MRRNRTANASSRCIGIPTPVLKNDPFIFLIFSSSMQTASHFSSIYDPGSIVPSNGIPIDKDRNDIYGFYVTAGLSPQIIAVLRQALVVVLVRSKSVCSPFLVANDRLTHGFQQEHVIQRFCS